MPRSATPLTSFLRPALGFALFISFLGLLPHLLFSLNTGGWHYLANAWDEDSYIGYALRHDDILYRLIGAHSVRALVDWLGLDFAVMAMDVITPFCSALIAAAIAWRLGFTTRRSLFLAGCLLVFALELLALCNSSMIGMYFSQALPFSSMVYPHWIRSFMPSMYENFFSLYKSPEPQITLIVHLATLYGLLRHAQTAQPRYVIVVLLLCLMFPYIYVSTGIALILCIGAYGFLGLLFTRVRMYLPMLGCAIVAAANYIYQFLHHNTGEGDVSFVFASHWPIFSVSMLWGAALLWLYAHHWGRNLRTRAWARGVTAPMLLGIVCCLVPFATLNQQVLTGYMVQSRTWEYYTDLTFTAFAILLFWPMIEIHVYPMISKGFRKRACYVAPVLVVLLVLAQLTNFSKYSRGNLVTLASVDMLEELRKDYPKGLPNLMLENTGDDSQTALRLGEPERLAVAGYQQTIKHPIARLNEAGYEKSAIPLRDQAFAYFDRQGLSPAQLQARMEEAAEASMGAIEVSYFFSYLDCWGPLSDFREQDVAGMKEKIPGIIADYAAFLKDNKRRNQFGEILYITRKGRPPMTSPGWTETLLTTRKIGVYRPVTVSIYRQVPLKK